MGDLIPFPRRSLHEDWLTKRQYANHRRRTTRWVEMMMRKGLPYRRDGVRAMFLPSEADAWLDERDRVGA